MYKKIISQKVVKTTQEGDEIVKREKIQETEVFMSREEILAELYKDYYTNLELIAKIESGYKIIEKEDFTFELEDGSENEELQANLKNWLTKKVAGEVNKIFTIFEAQISNFLADYPKSEILTFETKRVEADKYLADGSNIYIETLAKAKGWDPKVLAETIQKNAKAYLDQYSQLEAWKDGEIKAIEAKYNIT